MNGQSSPITELINQLSRLPGIGEKTAARLAFFILDAPEELAGSLSAAIAEVRAKTRRCGECGNLTADDPCSICSATSRDAQRICVVESTPDLLAVERTGEYRGLYHVLHGLIRPLDGVGPNDLNLTALLKRVDQNDIEEVILATNPSVEGEATAIYIRRLLDPFGIQVTRIASGLPMGGELEYADAATLGRALVARRAV